MFVNLADEMVVVESCLPSRDVQQLLEDTGRLVVFRGYGGAGKLINHTAYSVIWLPCTY